MSEYIKRHGSIMQDLLDNNLGSPNGYEKWLIQHGSDTPEAEQEKHIFERSNPNQSLVTDENGVMKWEDKLCYMSNYQEFTFDPDDATVMASGDIWLHTQTSTKGDYPELMEFNTWVRDNLGKPITVVWDGVIYDLEVTSVPPLTSYYIIGNPGYIGGSTRYANPPFSIVSTNKNTIRVYYCRNDAVHTLKLPRPEPIPVPISEDFIPSTVPVIQSAQIGQTIAVKSVDENGKPTEWEAVDGGTPMVLYFTTEDGYLYHDASTVKVTMMEVLQATLVGRSIIVYKKDGAGIIKFYTGVTFDVQSGEYVEFNLFEVSGGNVSHTLRYTSEYVEPAPV